MLRVRILTALALLSALVAAMFLLPDRYWAAFVLIFVLVGAFEWSRLAAYPGLASWLYVGLTLIIGIGLFSLSGADAHGLTGSVALPHLASLIFWAGIVPLWLAFGWRIKNRLVLAVVGWVVLLPTWLALVQLRALSPVLLLGLMAVIWVADSAAYFTGKAFGRHKLVPSISPGKTWEGVVGAFAAVALYALLWMSAVPVEVSANALWVRLLGILALWCMTYFGILGDLFESWMKRQAGLKDSGHIFPGHGGVLDRVDALTSTLPLAVLILYWLNIPVSHS